MTGVTCSFGTGAAPVLSDVSLVAEPGEFVAIVGPSGAGKSTLFRPVRPERRGVFYDGNDIRRTSASSPARRSASGGSALSGGQRQRLMLARALVCRPRYLFLDEATSALDQRTQAEVARNIDALDLTRIVIAHRLSTIRHADRIYVLAGGRVVETGNFCKLMTDGEAFRALTSRQLD